VTRAPQPEIGWNVIEGDEPGLIDPGPWFQWHSDRFELPAGIPVLARTAPANQAFTVGRSLGLQFHPELAPSVLDCWLDIGEAQLAARGIDVAALLAQTRSLTGAAARTRELVRRFIRNVATARVVAPEEHPIAPETHPDWRP